MASFALPPQHFRSRFAACSVMSQHERQTGRALADDPHPSRRCENAADAGIPSDNTATPQQPAAPDETQDTADAIPPLALAPRILGLFGKAVADSGLIGEERQAKLIYLALTSRLLDRPVSIVVKGPSSGGKSNLTDKVLQFFPPQAYYRLTGSSVRALAYGTASLEHRVLVIAEAAGLAKDIGAYLIRSLLSEGRVRYETVEKSESGGLQARMIERDGPTGLLTTTTWLALEPELETRLITVPIDDSPEQTRRIMIGHAAGLVAQGDLTPWLELQIWLTSGDQDVVVPFAATLANMIPPISIRLRRDFAALLRLIQTHALLHRATRPRDERGRIVAILEDYEVIYELIADLVAQGAGALVPKSVRETVDAVAAVIADKTLPVNRAKASMFGVDISDVLHATASLKEVAEALKRDKGTTSRRVREAIKLGYVLNNEPKLGVSAQLVLGDPLPEDRQVLPHPGDLRKECCSVVALSGGSAENGVGPGLNSDEPEISKCGAQK
jgi:hypothetical protein